MSGNTFGRLFTLTTFGESHGPAMGAVVDGCPAGLSLSEADIQPALDKRRPGASRMTSQRREPDRIEILSGIFEGKTTGTPIGLQVSNVDAKSKDYAALRDQFRPGHGDYSYFKKYGVRDHRGGGRASARETVMRVAAGAIAQKYLQQQFGTQVKACVSQIGPIKAAVLDFTAAKSNDFYFGDAQQLSKLEQFITDLRRAGDSIGAQVSLRVTQVPSGLGEPVFDKLDADLASAFMGINAAKAVSIGDGFDCVTQKGSEGRDALYHSGFETNHSGGILAGISTGQDILASIAFKPASSIRIPIASLDANDAMCDVVTTGRHDPCVGIRAVPVVEAMAALVLMDHIMRQRGQNGHAMV